MSTYTLDTKQDEIRILEKMLSQYQDHLNENIDSDEFNKMPLYSAENMALKEIINNIFDLIYSVEELN